LSKGSFSFAALQNIANAGDVPFPVLLGVMLMLLGFLIKSGLIPFHNQTVSSCQKAYAPVAAFYERSGN